jgi:hypothetical protein
MTNSTVSAADVCRTTLARKEAYAAELIAIATHENVQGFTLDWEDATGNDVGCFNALWGYVASALKPHGLSVSVSVDDSNHEGPMDKNSTDPWSTEWDWLGFVPWAKTLVDMGTYPGSWSNGLSYPAADHVAAFPCPNYRVKQCGLEGQVLDMLSHGVNPSGQLSPGIWPLPCAANGTVTGNGWTEVRTFVLFTLLDSHQLQHATGASRRGTHDDTHTRVDTHTHTNTYAQTHTHTQTHTHKRIRTPMRQRATLLARQHPARVHCASTLTIFMFHLHTHHLFT